MQEENPFDKLKKYKTPEDYFLALDKYKRDTANIKGGIILTNPLFYFMDAVDWECGAIIKQLKCALDFVKRKKAGENNIDDEMINSVLRETDQQISYLAKRIKWGYWGFKWELLSEIRQVLSSLSSSIFIKIARSPLNYVPEEFDTVEKDLKILNDICVRHIELKETFGKRLTRMSFEEAIKGIFERNITQQIENNTEFEFKHSVEMKQEDRDTKKNREDVIEAKPPVFLQNLLWILKYGKKWWWLLFIAILVSLPLYILPKLNLFGKKNQNVPLEIETSSTSFPAIKNTAEHSSQSENKTAKKQQEANTPANYERTPLYARTKKRVDDFYESIRNEKLDPWLFINAGVEIRVTKYNGDVINYKGTLFTGSPRSVFWSDDFIPPFIEDAIIKVFDQTIDECRKNSLDPEIYVYEAKRILNSFIYKIYNCMADMDQKLLKQAHPENSGRRDIKVEIEKMCKCLDEQYNAALLLTSIAL